MTQETQRALKNCAEWLVTCLRLGWSRNDLDALEEIWWQHHDYQGRLIKAS